MALLSEDASEKQRRGCRSDGPHAGAGGHGKDPGAWDSRLRCARDHTVGESIRRGKRAQRLRQSRFKLRRCLFEIVPFFRAVSRTNSFMVTAALRRISFRPRCKLLFHRRHRLTQQAGDLVGHHVLLVAQQDGDPQRLRHGGEQLFKPRLQAGSACSRGEEVAVLHPLFGLRLRPVRPAAQRVGGAVDGDPAQPEPDMVFAGELVAAAVQFEKDILRNLLGGVELARYAQRQREDHALMGLDQSAKFVRFDCHSRSRPAYTQVGAVGDAKTLNPAESLHRTRVSRPALSICLNWHTMERMASTESSKPKPVIWVGDSLHVLQSFPEDVKDEMGFALFQAQTGEKHLNAKPLTGFGSGVLEMVSDHRGDTFRAVYTVRLAGRVYVLHAFQKKSKKGIATPKSEMEMVKQRLRRAIELHAQGATI